MAEDLTGRKFGRLTVLSSDEKLGYWICSCDCGTIKSIRKDHLRLGKTISCGCYGREKLRESKIKHGKTDTRLYGVWYNMKTRCTCKSKRDYPRYGGRGITVCDEWVHDFQAFYDWAMGNGYDENAPRFQCTLDRIDNDKGYSPGNCRWITMKEQCANRRYGNRYVRSYNEDGTLVRKDI